MNFTMDGNEWFMIVSSFVAFCLYLMVRKQFEPIVQIVVWIFVIAFVESIDYFMAGTPFRLYYCADNVTYEPAAALIHIFLYPGLAFLFLYFYDKRKIRGMKLAGYLALWTGISVLFEWINTISGVFTYTGWVLIYSIPTYPISSVILILLLHFIRRNLHATEK